MLNDPKKTLMVAGLAAGALVLVVYLLGPETANEWAEAVFRFFTSKEG